MTLSYWNLIVENIRINYDFLIASQPKTDCRFWNNVDIPLTDHVKKIGENLALKFATFTSEPVSFVLPLFCV